MRPTFVQIAGPSVDLQAFISLVGKDSVNKVDTQRIDLVSKFADLTSECFDNRYRPGYHHLYLSFYYELPLMMETHLREYIGVSGLKVMAEYNGMMARGIVSGAFPDWYEFLKWCTGEDRELSVRKFGNVIYELYFRHYAFFGFSRTQRNDSTFMLT